MSQDPPQLAAFPSWYDDPAFTLAELARLGEAPEDTLYAWHRLAKAMFTVGVKRGRWLFSPRESFAFLLLASMYRLGVPVGHSQIKATFDFAQRGTAGNLYQLSADGLSYVCVLAPKIFDQVMTLCENDHVQDLDHAQ